jgi:hypothetical protein
MVKVLKQGHADGLCGIYCILNFLQQTEWADHSDNHALQSLLYTVQELGWLTPHYITEGFEEHHLKKIIDRQIEDYRLTYSTYFIRDTKFRSFKILADQVRNEGGAIITGEKSKAHWILLCSFDYHEKFTELIVWDSSGEGNVENKPPYNLNFPLDSGLLIIPSERRSVSWPQI